MIEGCLFGLFVLAMLCDQVSLKELCIWLANLKTFVPCKVPPTPPPPPLLSPSQPTPTPARLYKP